jgi:AcrR family transcriptional regulator
VGVGNEAQVIERPPAPIVALPAPERRSTRVRIVDAALALIARQGMATTTIDDLAREAGLSRATLYRTFPKGKDDVMRAVLETETARLLSELAVVLGTAHDLESLLIDGFVLTAERIGSSQALVFLLAHERQVVVSHLAFDEMDQILSLATSFLAPFFGRWLDRDRAERAGEFATRLLLTYLASPESDWRISDRAATTRFVRTYVLPGIESLRTA